MEVRRSVFWRQKDKSGRGDLSIAFKEHKATDRRGRWVEFNLNTLNSAGGRERRRKES